MRSRARTGARDGTVRSHRLSARLDLLSVRSANERMRGLRAPKSSTTLSGALVSPRTSYSQPAPRMPKPPLPTLRPLTWSRPRKPVWSSSHVKMEGAVFPPPPILGLGTTGGFKLQLQDRGNVGFDGLFEATQAVVDIATSRMTVP